MVLHNAFGRMRVKESIDFLIESFIGIYTVNHLQRKNKVAEII